MSMDPRMRPAAPRQYEDFDPKTSCSSEEGAETLLVHLPGFKKEQLRVQLTPSRVLKISGERLLGGNKWQRFMKEARVPPGCDAKEISAKFEGGVLYVKQPKLITPAEPIAEVPKPPPTQSQPIPAPAPAPAPALEPAPAPAMKEEAEEEKGKEFEKAESRRGELEADARNKYEEESRDKEEIERKSERVAERWRSGGVFEMMKKPENMKMLFVMVVAAIALALHLAYVNKVCRRYTTNEEL